MSAPTVRTRGSSGLRKSSSIGNLPGRRDGYYSGEGLRVGTRGRERSYPAGPRPARFARDCSHDIQNPRSEEGLSSGIPEEDRVAPELAPGTDLMPSDAQLVELDDG